LLTVRITHAAFGGEEMNTRSVARNRGHLRTVTRR